MSTRRRRSKCALSPDDAAAIVLAIPEHDEGPVGQWDTVGAGKAVVVWWDCEDRNLSVRVQLSTRETTVSMQLDPSTRCGEPLTQSVTVGTLDPAGDPLDLVRLLEVGWDWLTGRRLPHDWPAHVPEPGCGLGGREAGAVTEIGFWATVLPVEPRWRMVDRDPDAGCEGKGKGGVL